MTKQHHLDHFQWVQGNSRQISFNLSENRGVGSTCTLVADNLLTTAPEAISAEIAKALLGIVGTIPLPKALRAGVSVGVILIDTANLSEDSGKTTDDDIRVASQLSQICFGGDSSAQA